MNLESWLLLNKKPGESRESAVRRFAKENQFEPDQEETLVNQTAYDPYKGMQESDSLKKSLSTIWPEGFTPQQDVIEDPDWMDQVSAGTDELQAGAYSSLGALGGGFLEDIGLPEMGADLKGWAEEGRAENIEEAQRVAAPKTREQILKEDPDSWYKRTPEFFPTGHEMARAAPTSLGAAAIAAPLGIAAGLAAPAGLASLAIGSGVGMLAGNLASSAQVAGENYERAKDDPVIREQVGVDPETPFNDLSPEDKQKIDRIATDVSQTSFGHRLYTSGLVEMASYIPYGGIIQRWALDTGLGTYSELWDRELYGEDVVSNLVEYGMPANKAQEMREKILSMGPGEKETFIKAVVQEAVFGGGFSAVESVVGKVDPRINHSAMATKFQLEKIKEGQKYLEESQADIEATNEKDKNKKALDYDPARAAYQAMLEDQKYYVLLASKISEETRKDYDHAKKLETDALQKIKDKQDRYEQLQEQGYDAARQKDHLNWLLNFAEEQKLDAKTQQEVKNALKIEEQIQEEVERIRKEKGSQYTILKESDLRKKKLAEEKVRVERQKLRDKELKSVDEIVDLKFKEKEWKAEAVKKDKETKPLLTHEEAREQRQTEREKQFYDEAKKRISKQISNLKDAANYDNNDVNFSSVTNKKKEGDVSLTIDELKGVFTRFEKKNPHLAGKYVYLQNNEESVIFLTNELLKGKVTGTNKKGLTADEKRSIAESKARESLKAHGFAFNDKIYLNADNLKGENKNDAVANAVETGLFHEPITHIGLKKFVGEEKFGTFLDGFYKKHKDTINNWADKEALSEDGKRAYLEESDDVANISVDKQRELAEEYIAHKWVEHGVRDPDIIEKIGDGLKNILFSMFGKNRISEVKVRSILADVQRHYLGGKQNFITGDAFDPTRWGRYKVKPDAQEKEEVVTEQEAPVETEPTTVTPEPAPEPEVTPVKVFKKGTLTLPDGDKYVGELKDGEPNGQGIITYPDGTKYVGKFKDGKENGQGTFTYPDGEKYEGEYKDGERNGQGTITYPDGTKSVVEYKDGELEGTLLNEREDEAINEILEPEEVITPVETTETKIEVKPQDRSAFKSVNYALATVTAKKDAQKIINKDRLSKTKTKVKEVIKEEDKFLGGEDIRFSKTVKRVPKKTKVAYKLVKTFRSRPDEIFPLFINEKDLDAKGPVKQKPIPLGEWVSAQNIPTKGFAKRPGWHSGQIPKTVHLLKKDGTLDSNRMWVEVEISDDVNWQDKANKTKTRDLPDTVPEYGNYEFAAPSLKGAKWHVSGEMKVNRFLSLKEADDITTRIESGEEVKPKKVKEKKDVVTEEGKTVRFSKAIDKQWIKGMKYGDKTIALTPFDYNTEQFDDLSAQDRMRVIRNLREALEQEQWTKDDVKEFRLNKKYGKGHNLDHMVGNPVLPSEQEIENFFEDGMSDKLDDTYEPKSWVQEQLSSPTTRLYLSAGDYRDNLKTAEKTGTLDTVTVLTKTPGEWPYIGNAGLLIPRRVLKNFKSDISTRSLIAGAKEAQTAKKEGRDMSVSPIRFSKATKKIDSLVKNREVNFSKVIAKKSDLAPKEIISTDGNIRTSKVLLSRAARFAMATSGPQQNQGWRQRLARWSTRRLVSQGTLNDSDFYKALRRKAKGEVFNAEQAGRKLYDILANTKQPNAIYTYMTTLGADPKMITNPVERKAAKDAKAQIQQIGRDLVAKGMMEKNDLSKYNGQYLPRLYFKYLLNDDDRQAIRTRKGKISDLDYLKKRKNISEGVRQLILGEVKDPAFLASKATTVPVVDMKMIDWLQQIASEGKERGRNWVLPSTLINYDIIGEMAKIASPKLQRDLELIDTKGVDVSSHWLLKESERLDKLSTKLFDVGMIDNQKRKLVVSVTKDMRKKANDIIGSEKIDQTDYRKIPDLIKYGKLGGMMVRKEIYDDILGGVDMNTGDMTMAERVIGDGGYMGDFSRFWKWSKVSANPPSWVRNFVSNLVLMNLGGVPFYRMPDLFISSIRDMRGKNGGKYYKLAKDLGLTAGTFSNVELGRIEREFISMQTRMKKGKGHPMEILGMVKGTFNKFRDWTSDKYGSIDALGKTMMLKHQLDSKKIKPKDLKAYSTIEMEQVDSAALQAEKFLFDYSNPLPSVKYLRSAVVGAPFLSFYSFALPIMIETAITKPWKFIPYYALGFAMKEMFKENNDLDEEQYEGLKVGLSEYLREKAQKSVFPIGVVPLPWIDDSGRVQFMDLSYLYPWGTFAEMASEIQSAQPFDAIKTAGLLGGPLLNMASTAMTGIDPFTRESIVNEFSLSPTEQGADVLGYFWNLTAPPMLHGLGPGHGQGFGAVKRLMESMTGQLTKEGEARFTKPQAIARMFGMNLTPLAVPEGRNKMLRYEYSRVQKLQREMKRRFRDMKIMQESDEDIKEAMEEYVEKLTEMSNDFMKKVRASTPPIKLLKEREKALRKMREDRAA